MLSAVSPSKRPGAAEMVRLPLRVHPEVDEPILSFLVRLAKANMYEHVNGLTALAGLASQYIDNVARCPVDMAGLESASGIVETRLRYMQYLPLDADHVVWMGKSVHRHLVHTKHRKWCPVCLQEEAYHRASWDLLPIGACHRHRVALASRCPSCREEVGWLGKTVVNCRCGGDLRRAGAQPVSDAAAEAARCILDGLQGKRAGTAGLTGSEALWLATVLGWMAARGQCHPPTERTMWWKVDDRVRDLEVGWAALHDWPRGFERHLRRHYPDDRAMWPLVRWVTRRYDGQLGSEMAGMMREHGAEGYRSRRPAPQSTYLHAAIA